MHDGEALEDLPILLELGTSLRAAAVREDARVHRRTRSRARRRQRLTWSTGAVAASAAAVLAVSTGLGGLGSGAASAASTLDRAAVVAAGQPDELPAPDQYFYVRSRVTGVVLEGSATNADQPPARVSVVREIWQSLRRPGRLLTTPQDGASAAPTPGNGRVGNVPALGAYRLGSLRLSRAALAAFPTDPEEVYSRFRAAVDGRGPSPDAQVFDDIVEALGEQPAPSRLRGGLYGALARVPGVEVTSSTASATTVGIDVAGIRHEASFDPETAELLATQVAPEGAPNGDATTRTVYERRAVTSNPRGEDG